MHRAEDDALALPFPVRSGGSRHHGAWTLDATTNALLVDDDDGGHKIRVDLGH